MEKIEKNKNNSEEKIITKKEKTGNKISVQTFLENFQDEKLVSLKYLKTAFLNYVNNNKLNEGKEYNEWEKIFIKFINEEGE
ncbi:MAG: hypothetical protein SNJ64_03295 [Endomicrobiia bacterium]